MFTVPLRLAAILLLALGIQSCQDSKTNPVIPEGATLPPLQISEPWKPYRFDGARVIVDNGDTGSIASAYCSWSFQADPSLPEDSLIPYRNPLGRFDTFLVRQDRNELTFYYARDTGAAGYVFATHFVRSGAGSGLQGTWIADEYRIRELDTWGAYGRIQFSDLIEERVEFTGNSYRWGNRPRVTWAAAQIVRWTRPTWSESQLPNGELHDIEITAVDSNAVRMRGLKSRETVVRRRIRESDSYAENGDVQVSSSDPNHATYVRKEVLDACPEEQPWFDAFLESNRKSVLLPPP